MASPSTVLEEYFSEFYLYSPVELRSFLLIFLVLSLTGNIGHILYLDSILCRLLHEFRQYKQICHYYHSHTSNSWNFAYPVNAHDRYM